MAENQIIGTSNNDLLSDTPVQDEIFALGGNDKIQTTDGNDIIHGDDGIDELAIDYAEQNENIFLFLQNYDRYSGHGFLNINLPSTGNHNYINFSSIEKLQLITGSGNDIIDSNNNHSDDTVNAGAGNDQIFTGKGFDVVNGGSGFDVVSLNFSNSYGGVTSSLTNSNSGEYISNDSSVEFSNIEAISVIGSSDDDVLAAPTGNTSGTFLPIIPLIDGGSGFDQLIVNYGDRYSNHDVIVNNYYGGNINTYDPQTGNNTSLDFRDIESFNITTGRGNNLIDLGYNSFSDDIIHAGAGNDQIFTGKGFDVVNGGSGFDVVSLNFSNSYGGVTSSLINSNSGEYISNDSSVEFSNIEAISVIGSSDDDVLAAPTGNTSGTFLPIIPLIDGGSGFDQLIVNYSDRYSNHDVIVNNYYGGNINTYDPQTGNNTSLDFRDIESFNITTGRGNNLIDLGYDNYSDDTINAGAGSDRIFTGKGFDVVNGGSGFDVLNLNFSNSVNGITSRLINGNSGEYISSDSLVEFSNIEAINVFGSQQDDVLIATTSTSTGNAAVPFFPMIDGQNGFDQLVVNYSDNNSDLNINLNSFGYYQNGNNTSVSGNLDAIFANNPTLIQTTSFNNIESFNITGGRGNDNIELGYNNFSDDTVNAGTGNDYISTGKGSDLVDGGSGFDLLNLDFYSSTDGVTSSLSNDNSGEYTSSNSSVEFKNIESFNIIGSQYDDVLVALASNNALKSPNLVPAMIDGREGFDELVVDYSNSNSDLNIHLNSFGYYQNGNNTSVSGNLDVSALNNSASIKTVNFSNIEGFDLSGGRGNDNIELGYNNVSDDRINAGAGNDQIIVTGKGFDLVNGGSGFDVLTVDFSNSVSRVTSNLNSNNSGEYISVQSSVEFSNIEAANIIGSQYNDVLVAIASPSNPSINSSAIPLHSYVDGGLGFDKLIVDYSDSYDDLNIDFNFHGGNSGELFVFQPENSNPGWTNFNEIESFVLTTGGGDNLIDLGYDSSSNDIVNAGAGNDQISTGRGSDVVDGGSGFDVLNLDFSNSVSGVTSNINTSNSGKYISTNSVVEFSNIEAINVVGSAYDDKLIATASDIHPGINSTVFSLNSFIDGGAGFDKLVIDYSGIDSTSRVSINSNSANSGSINVYSPETGTNSILEFNNIENIVMMSSESGQTLI